MNPARIVLISISLLISASANARAAEAQELPAAAAAAVKRLFPTSSIEAVGIERELGVLYYEVAVRDGNARSEIEVTAEGTIGEIETAVELADLPQRARDGILRSAGGASPAAVARHEVRGAPQDGKFVAVDPPLVFFEAEYMVGGVRREITVTPDGNALPPEAEGGRDGDDDDRGDDDND